MHISSQNFCSIIMYYINCIITVHCNTCVLGSLCQTLSLVSAKNVQKTKFRFLRYDLHGS